MAAYAFSLCLISERVRPLIFTAMEKFSLSRRNIRGKWRIG